MNWAISKYEDAILKFAIGIRLNIFKTPRTVKRDGDRDIQCCRCEEKNPGMAHIMCGCRKGTGWRYMNKRHRAICDAVASAIREEIMGVHIRDDERILKTCGELTDAEGALKRPDLMYESFVTKKGKTRKIYNLTEITSSWAWEGTLDAAYEAEVRKYTQVQIRFQQAMPEYDEVVLNVIVVSPSGVFLRRSQKGFAVATMLPRNRLATHARFIVDAATTQAHEHYGAYCNALSQAKCQRSAFQVQPR
jgi:hypothetical protein